MFSRLSNKKLNHEPAEEMQVFRRKTVSLIPHHIDSNSGCTAPPLATTSMMLMLLSVDVVSFSLPAGDNAGACNVKWSACLENSKDGLTHYYSSITISLEDCEPIVTVRSAVQLHAFMLS